MWKYSQGIKLWYPTSEAIVYWGFDSTLPISSKSFTIWGFSRPWPTMRRTDIMHLICKVWTGSNVSFIQPAKGSIRHFTNLVPEVWWSFGGQHVHMPTRDRHSFYWIYGAVNHSSYVLSCLSDIQLDNTYPQITTCAGSIHDGALSLSALQRHPKCLTARENCRMLLLFKQYDSQWPSRPYESFFLTPYKNFAGHGIQETWRLPLALHLYLKVHNQGWQWSTCRHET